jgi:trimeric autotransporter adhesin
MACPQKILSPLGRVTATGSCLAFAAGIAVAQPCVPEWDQAMAEHTFNGFFNAVAVFQEFGQPVVHVGGAFNAPYSRIAKWNDGFWFDVGGGINNSIQTLRVFDLGSGPALYAGGGFTTAGGLPAAKVARWDGQTWSAIGELGATTSSIMIRALEVFDDGAGLQLYAGGNVTTAGGQPVNRIVRWNGTQWSQVGDGLNHHIFALAVFNDGTGAALYAAGQFAASGTETVRYIGKWDGQQWTEVGGGLGTPATSLAVADLGTGPALYVGGLFTTAGPIAANNVARWDGQQWSALGSGTSGRVNALLAYDNGSGPALYVGGLFAEAGGQTVNNIAKWDGTSWSALGVGVGATVNDLAIHDGATGPGLVVVGAFGTAGGETARYIARWGCPPASPCYADCDGNGFLSIDDFLCFINEFAHAQTLPPAQQETHYANCNGTSTEPFLSVDDFLCFINEFAVGCP